MGIDRSRIQRSNKYWEELYKAVPDARRAAVEAMGEAIKKEVDSQIAARIDDGAGHVQSWQEIRIGSRGGYAAVSPCKYENFSARGNPLRSGGRSAPRVHTYRGKAVSAKQVTAWLERGHSVRKCTGKDKRFREVTKSTKGYVPARRFL